MTNEEELQQAIAIFKDHYLTWKANPERKKNGYSYESTFDQMSKSMLQAVFQNSVGKVGKSKNVKKKSTQNLEK